MAAALTCCSAKPALALGQAAKAPRASRVQAVRVQAVKQEQKVGARAASSPADAEPPLPRDTGRDRRPSRRSSTGTASASRG